MFKLKAAVLAAFVFGVSLPACGIINLRFTPADMIRSSSAIYLLKCSPPQGKTVAVRVVKTIKGQAMTRDDLVFDWRDRELGGDEVSAAFAGEENTTAVLLLSRRAGRAGEKEPAGIIQIGTRWFSVYRNGEAWALDQDQREMSSVWAGDAAMLARAAEATAADPAISFPVKSRMTWDGDSKLGKLAGRCNGCLNVDFGGPIGLCAVVLSEGGDRIIASGKPGAPPSDITRKLRLTTASQLAAPGDFNGDGRMDLATWDGKALEVATQGPDGTFGAEQWALPEAVASRPWLSMQSLDVGVPGRPGLLVGTAHAPQLLIPAAGGRMTLRALREGEPAKLKPGGVCLPGDFDGDGRCDVIELFENGILFYAGQTGDHQFKAPVATQLAVVKSPRAAVCSDYDMDGRLDLLVGGEDGVAVLGRPDGQRWANVTPVTAELAYHGNANRPPIVAAAACDVNNDGRQSVALFYPGRNPLLFFNRGFACFGLARELELSGGGNAPAAADTVDPFAPAAPAGESGPKLKSAVSLQKGQSAGTVLDLNGDGTADLLAVDAEGQIWVLFGKVSDGGTAIQVSLALSPGERSPLTVGIYRGARCIAVHVVSPGRPAFTGCAEPGRITLRWTTPRGDRTERHVDVVGNMRVELSSN